MIEILKFEATWCYPCKILTKNLDVIEYKAIDVEKNRDLQENYNIKAVPTLVFIKDGLEVDRVVGVVSREKVQEILDKYK